MSSFLISLVKKERAGCYTLIVFLMSCDLWCSGTLPRAAVVWCAVYDCGLFNCCSKSFTLNYILFRKVLKQNTQNFATR